MAKQLSFVSVDTPIAGFTTNNIGIEPVNFGADFVEKSDSKKGEILITNITAPISAPESFRFALSNVEDAYKGSSIEPSQRAVTKRGVSILVSSSLTMKETDTVDTTYSALVPVKVWTVMTFPSIESLTAVLAEKVFRRHVAGFYYTGLHSEGRIGQLLRGSLIPPDVN